MKSINDLSKADIEKIKLISFDADGVTIERGTEVLEKDGLLTVKTKVITPVLLDKIGKLKKRFRVNFSSGRNLIYLNYMFGKVLWDKASIQGENGLFTLIDGKVMQLGELTPTELELLENIRYKIKVLAETDGNIKGFEPKQFIISVHCKSPSEKIEEIVKNNDNGKQLSCVWVSNEAYDIYLRRINKGSGLMYLCNHLNISTNEVLSVGNDQNDQPMLKISKVSVTTDDSKIEADFKTTGKLNLGGEEVVDKLLDLIN